jgi:GNAT superfamily N-acetyltransferase
MSIGGLTAPVRLSASFDFTQFDCGTASLNDWLTRQALKNEASGASRTYVVCIENAVVGYYCLATGAVVRAEAPKPIQRNMPDPIPVLVLGRMAVDQTYQGRGIGSALLRDALLRVLQAAEIVGVRALLVHAISEEAKRFYLSHGFVESPIEPQTLCLALETAQQALET